MQSGPPFPFQPRGANANPPTAQASGAVGTAVSQINLPNAPYDGETTARFVVDGTQPIAWAYGSQAGLTYANGVSMLANSAETFMIPMGVSQISVIALAAGSTLRIIPGDGV